MSETKESDLALESMNKYDQLMTVERLTVSLDAQLAAVIREAAAVESQSVSYWLAEAARRRLSTRGLGEIVTEWEAIHGEFSDDELATARHRLGI